MDPGWWDDRGRPWFKRRELRKAGREEGRKKRETILLPAFLPSWLPYKD
jgi:hypothetical protein